MFPGTPCAVQEVQRDRQTMLKELSFVVATDTWNAAGNRDPEPELNFM